MFDIKNNFSEKFFNIEEIVPNFCIDEARREALCFRENLLICLKKAEIADDEKTPVGTYLISTEKISRQGLDFLVNVDSTMKINGFLSGTKINGSVTNKLLGLEEKRNEYIHKNEREEKILFLEAQDNFYYMQTTEIAGPQKMTNERNLKICCSKNLLTEAANILLMRYLALTNFHGTLQFKCLTIDGKIAFCIYKCSAAKKMKYNEFSLEIYTIARRFHKENGSVQKIVTQMTKNGRILKNDCLEIAYTLEINPLENLHDIENGKKSERFPLRNTWHKDFELVSKYFDQKILKKSQKVEYFENHQELKNLIADYVQSLLFVKPQDVLTFTIQHFLSFANEMKIEECCSNCDDIKSEIKLFPNFDTNLKKSYEFPSKELKLTLTPDCPACSICSSKSSEICTIFSRKNYFSASNCTLYGSEFSDLK